MYVAIVYSKNKNKNDFTFWFQSYLLSLMFYVYLFFFISYLFISWVQGLIIFPYIPTMSGGVKVNFRVFF